MDQGFTLFWKQELDTTGLQRVAGYMLRCPVSIARIVSVNEDGQVLYKAEKTQCQSFPRLGSETLRGGAPRNFEAFDPLEFLAEITQHIPQTGPARERYLFKARGSRPPAGPKTGRIHPREGLRLHCPEEDATRATTMWRSKNPYPLILCRSKVYAKRAAIVRQSDRSTNATRRGNDEGSRAQEYDGQSTAFAGDDGRSRFD